MRPGNKGRTTAARSSSPSPGVPTHQVSEAKYPPIRLSRATAFRGAKIREKHNQQVKGTYVEVVDMASLSRLNNSHALHLLGRVTEAVGEQFEPVGVTMAEKLASVRCDAAGKLLSKTSWSEFFKGGERSGGDGEAGRSGHGEGKEVERGRSREQRETTAALQGQEDDFSAMIVRVESLWRDVRMSREDRAFYRKSLCRAPPQSPEHRLEVARYIAVLQEHRMATIRTMQAIGLREGALRRCYDVLAAMKRKSAYRDRGQQQQLLQQQEKVKKEGLTDTNFVSFNPVRDATARDDLAWKEELACCLKDLQLASLEVIRRIQWWRRNLWRPRPFLWSGHVDYLHKMRRDMNVLVSPVFVRCLDSIPLQRRDLECVLYDAAPEDQDEGLDEGQDEGHDGARFYAASDEGLEDTPLRAAFLVGINWPELRAASQVVLAHDVLMQALQEESAKLVQAGVFIPTLKQSSEQQQQQQHVSEPPPLRGGSPASTRGSDLEA